MTWQIFHQRQDLTWHPYTRPDLPAVMSEAQAKAYAEVMTREGTLWRTRAGGRFEARLVIGGSV